MLRKAYRKVFGEKQIFTDQEFVDMKKSREMLLKELSTPAPAVESPEMLEEADIRLPRIPFNQQYFYLMRWQSVILRMICLKLKQEIFRETLKEGFDWEPAFKMKCQSCGKIMQESPKRCLFCGSVDLVPPDPTQKLVWNEWVRKANDAEQTLLEVCLELEDDLNTVDDLYLVLIKDYVLTKNQELTGKIKEVMRGDPVRFRIVADESGRRGGKFWVCPTHREDAQGSRGRCQVQNPDTEQVCNLELHDVHYVETQAGGKNAVKFYIAGEVIHTSKYEPSRLYGISPVFTLWIITRTLQLMDRYAENLYEKGRLKGVLGVSSDNPDYLAKWWDETQQKLRQDQHYMPVVAIEAGEGGKGKIEFVKLMDSLQEMQSAEYKQELRMNIAALYGISPIFQADVSSGGGLANEGLQITVTDRAVEMGQAIYHNKIFPELAKAHGITDWTPKLKPSRELDEMAELQRMELKVSTAERMLQLGFDVKFEEEQFVFSGEIKQPEQSQETLPSGTPPKQLPAQAGGTQPQPDNRQGEKPCPPGQVSTPEKPKCHPVEWDRPKQKALQKTNRDLARQLKELKKKIRQTEVKIQLAGAEYGKGSKEQKVFQNLLRDYQYLKIQLEGKIGKMAFTTASSNYFNPKYSQEEDEVNKGYGPDPSAGSINAGKRLKVFDMERPNDESGISGTGLVASGIVFPDGKVVLRWNSETASTTEFDSYEDFLKIHVKSHPDNKTKIHFYNLKEGETVEKSGDMLAHYACVGAKLKKAGILPDAMRGKAFKDWWDKEKATNPKAKKINEACNKAGEIGESDPDYPDPYNTLKVAGEFMSATAQDLCKSASPPQPVESGQAVEEEKEKVENHFLQAIEKGLVGDIVAKIKKILGKGTISKILLMKLLTEVLTKAGKKTEKLGFAEILRAYGEGKEMVGEDGTIEKGDDEAPRFALNAMTNFNQSDQQVLRAIYDESPFWEAFANMSKATSEKLHDILEESYEPINSARMKATVRDVMKQYKEQGNPISKAEAEQIAYGRIGKSNLASIIEKMKRTIHDEVFHLERIARTETTGIAAKGREMAMLEREGSDAYRFDWFGIVDNRTSDICKWIETEVERIGKGRGVKLGVLKDIMKAAVVKFNPGWGYREWVPHANCRRVLRRVV